MVIFFVFFLIYILDYSLGLLKYNEVPEDALFRLSLIVKPCANVLIFYGRVAAIGLHQYEVEG